MKGVVWFWLFVSCGNKKQAKLKAWIKQAENVRKFPIGLEMSRVSYFMPRLYLQF